MLHQTFLFLGQLWQLFEVSQILEFLRYVEIDCFTFPLTCKKYGGQIYVCWISKTVSSKLYHTKTANRADPGLMYTTVSTLGGLSYCSVCWVGLTVDLDKDFLLAWNLFQYVWIRYSDKHQNIQYLQPI